MIDKAPYGVCVFQNVEKDSVKCKVISFFCTTRLMEVSAFRMLKVCFALVMVKFMCCEIVSFGLE